MNEKNCKTCEHARFDEIWGEYKCVKMEKTITSVKDRNNCVFYEKRKDNGRS